MVPLGHLSDVAEPGGVEVARIRLQCSCYAPPSIARALVPQSLLMRLHIGTARPQAGKLTYGTFDLFEHPTGGKDALPVVIAQGDPSGPTFWLTAGIHGPEHVGLQVIHQLLTRELIKRLHGTIIAIPALCPGGLLTKQRHPYYHDGDPNRLFPDGKPRQEDLDENPPSVLELAYARLFDVIRGTEPVGWIDLHNAWTNSVSFIFRDRVLYRDDGSARETKQRKGEADKLDGLLSQMCEAYGHPVVNESPPKHYLAQKLHRSTTASAVSVARFPALTMELGTGLMPDPDIVRASQVGLRNVFRWAGMLEGEREPITGIKLPRPGYPCRHRDTPRVSVPCIVRHLVEPGDIVKTGDDVGEVRDIWGRPVGEKVLKSVYDGWVMGRHHGIVQYPGSPLYCMAIRDELPTVMPYPAGFWEQ